MRKEGIRINRQTWWRFFLNIKEFATAGKTGRRARWLFALIVISLLGLNGLSVLNSYVGRDFMTAIEYRNRAEFVRMALIYIGVFAASTVVTAMYRYMEETLGLVWREWATRESIIGYSSNRVYYRLKVKGELGNPDQRITDDIRIFSTTTLSFVLMILNGSFTVIAFSGVLWSISPSLFIVAVLYASAGTFLTFVFGRPLVRLNYDQLDKEANLRSSLVYLRGNAESLALSRREGHLIYLSLRNLRDLAGNFRRIITINRRLNFFTTGYNWLIQIIPFLIVAPMFFERKVQFGVVTQSALAFTQLLGAFSLIITQFQSISSYTAVFARLALLKEAAEKEKEEEVSSTPSFTDEKRIVYEGLTLRSPRSGRVLIKDLSIEIPHGKRILVRGPDETTRTALFQATAGFWQATEGKIVRPRLEQILMIPEMPYLPPGTVRELLMRPWPEEKGTTDQDLESSEVSEERVLKTFRNLNIDSLLGCIGGLDERHHWENTLPMDKQQLLVVARVLLSGPRFVFLEKPSSTLQPKQVDLILNLLKEREISIVTFESHDRRVNLMSYDTLLDLEEEGAWTCRCIKRGRVVDDHDIPMVAA